MMMGGYIVEKIEHPDIEYIQRTGYPPEPYDWEDDDNDNVGGDEW